VRSIFVESQELTSLDCSYDVYCVIRVLMEGVGLWRAYFGIVWSKFSFMLYG